MNKQNVTVNELIFCLLRYLGDRKDNETTVSSISSTKKFSYHKWMGAHVYFLPTSSSTSCCEGVVSYLDECVFVEQQTFRRSLNELKELIIIFIKMHSTHLQSLF